MNKKFLRLGIILVLASVVLALILSGTPRRSKAANITLQDGQYVRDSWVYGFVNPGGGRRTDGGYSHPTGRFEKITDITNYDIRIANNAMVRIDTAPGGSNNFNGLTVGEGATLTHTPMGQNSSLEMTGFVNEWNYFAVRWTGWLYVPQTEQYMFYISSDDGSELYLDLNEGEGSDNNLTRITLTADSGKNKDSWSSHGTRDHYDYDYAKRPPLTAGLHRIVVNYFDDSDEANIILGWRVPASQPSFSVIPSVNFCSDFSTCSPGSGDGLTGDYYNWNRDWDPNADYLDHSIFKVKNYRYTRLDPSINFTWGHGSPFVSYLDHKSSDPTIEKIANQDNRLDPQNQYPGGFSKMIINVKDGSINLNQGAKISADGAGFAGGFPGAGMEFERGYGPGAGNRDDSGNGNGGSYCGRGMRVGSGFEGVVYGGGQANQPNTAIPTPLGSGGGGGQDNSGWKVGGGGGGFISLIAKDLVIAVNGRISAEGGIGSPANNNGDGGHGSGGTVYIYASNFFSQQGTSLISVNGGARRVKNGEGFEGGAGRVAVYYPQNNPIPQNVTAAGFDGAESCPVVAAAIGAPGTTTNNLSITKMISPATVKPNETVDIILSIYNPSDSPQIVNIKDDKFYNWDTYPAPGSNLWDLLNVRLENGVTMETSDVIMNSDNIEFKNITVPPSLSGLPGRIKYTVTVPENP